MLKSIEKITGKRNGLCDNNRDNREVFLLCVFHFRASAFLPKPTTKTINFSITGIS